MSVNRVKVIWTGPTLAGGGLSTFMFDTAVGTPAQQAAAVATFLANTDSQRGSGTLWEIDQDVQQLNQVTEALEGVTSVTASTGGGTATGDFLPPTNQGLLRLFTSGVVGGRLLRGRLFLPAAVESSSNRTVGVTYQGAYNTAALALIADANTTWIVWSRTHGFTAAIVTADVWSQWAVLRSRRD